MRNLEVVSHQQRLDALFCRVKDLPDDPEILSHWAKYLCVCVAGFLEVGVRALFRDYAKDKSSPQVANFVESELRRFRNPKMQRICDLAREFDRQWGEQLQTETDGDLKEAIDSIMTNRHHIAHGQNVGLTYVRIKDYYRRSLKVLDLIESHLR